MKILYANVRGLNSKLVSIKEVLSETEPTIALFAETHLPNNKGIKIDGYSFFGRAREGKPGGGVGIFVKNDMKVSVSPHHSTRNLEIMWASIHRDKETPFYVGVYYGKQESDNKEDVREEIDNLTEEILELQSTGEILLFMDGNGKLGLIGEEISRNGGFLNDMIDECELVLLNAKDNCIGKITRQNRKKKDEFSAIDFVLASQEAYPTITKMFIDEEGEFRIRSKNDSDHNTIIVDLKMNNLPKEKIVRVSEWNINAPPEKWEQFRSELAKSEKRAIEIMADTNVPMTTRYKKWERLLYSLAAKTIGRTSYKIGGPPRDSQAIKVLKVEKKECKKDFERETDQILKGQKLQKYYDKQKEIHLAMEAEEKEAIEKKCERIISETGSNALWNERRNLNRDETPLWMVTKDSNGQRITDPEENKENVASYYEGLYKDNYELSHPYHLEVEEAIHKLCHERGTEEEENHENNRMPTEREVQEIINNKKNKKATTDWKNWLLKKGEIEMVRFIMPVIRAFWREEIPPYQWNEGLITNIWKGKGDRERLENHRGITVSSSIGLIAEEIINNRLLKTISFTQAQAGGRKGASPTNHIFILRNVMELAKAEGRNLIISFFDVQKAFDRANMNDMLYILHKNGLRGKIWRLCMSLNKGLTARIKTKAGLTRQINRETGGKQGGKLMVPMFSKTMDTLAEDLSMDTSLGINLSDSSLPSLIFMDDVMSFAEGILQQNATLNAINEFAEKHHIKWGINKCKVLEIGTHGEGTNQWKLGDNVIENCESYKYLGDIIQRNGKNDENLKSRILRAKAAVRAINTCGKSNVMKKIEMKFILKLHEAVTLSTLLSNAETWPLNKASKNELDKMEVWAWKSMIGLPMTTPTAAVMFATGALFASIRIEMKQLIYLHQVLQKDDDHLTKVSLQSIKEHNVGWARQIEETLVAWELETDWDVIKSKSRNAWKKEVEEAAERLNKSAIKTHCIARKRGEEITKTKTKTIVPIIDDPHYSRKPQPFVFENNKLITRAYIMGRYGMLKCAANFSCGYGSKNCSECGVIDDEDHRINHCTLWQDRNLCRSDDKIDFNLIYSENIHESIKVVEIILKLWDLGNGKNAMRTCP